MSLNINTSLITCYYTNDPYVSGQSGSHLLSGKVKVGPMTRLLAVTINTLFMLPCAMIAGCWHDPTMQESNANLVIHPLLSAYIYKRNRARQNMESAVVHAREQMLIRDVSPD